MLKPFVFFISFTFFFDAQSAVPVKSDLLPTAINFTDFKTISVPNKEDAVIQFDERNGIIIQFPKNDTYPGVSFSRGKAFTNSDWSDVGGISLNLYNAETNPVIINLRLDDSKTLLSSQACSGYTKIAPSSHCTIVFPMPSTYTGMRLPPSDFSNNNGFTWVFYGPNPNCKDIQRFTLFLTHPQSPITIYLKSVSWLPKPEMRGWIDQYGQNTKTTWNGKITQDSDFQKQDQEELDWFKNHRQIRELDRYGGFKLGVQLPKSKYFHTSLLYKGTVIPPQSVGSPQYTKSHWCLVTPEGHLFFSLGMDCVNFGDATTIQGRETWFQKIPGEPVTVDKVNFFQLNLQKKYGDDWKESFKKRTFQRLKSWDFNTLGNWCDPSFYEAHQLPYTKCLGYQHPPLFAPTCSLPDFFHPDFPKLVAEGLAKGVVSSKNDPWCIGYFIDNELCWDTWENSGLADRGTVTRAALSALPGTPAREALIHSLQTRYPSIASFNKAWGTDLSSWNQQVSLRADQLTPAAHEDAEKFLYQIAKQYYSVISSELKKLDPNHLYLGSRLNQRPMPVVKAAAEYCDVISFNVYADTIVPEKWKFLSSMGKPAIVSEFHFSSAERGMFQGRMTCNGHKARADSFSKYVESVAEHPNFVGCHWFQYIDEPISGRWFDGENYPIGFISITDKPYNELCFASLDCIKKVIDFFYSTN